MWWWSEQWSRTSRPWTISCVVARDDCTSANSEAALPKPSPDQDTHVTACFIHIWFNWISAMGQVHLIEAVAKQVRSAEYLTYDYWRVCLGQLVFRALALQDEFFTMRPQYAPDGNLKIEWGRKEMIQIVMRWTAKHPLDARVKYRVCFGNIGLVTKILQCSNFLGVKGRFQRWCFFSI